MPQYNNPSSGDRQDQYLTDGKKLFPKHYKDLLHIQSSADVDAVLAEVRAFVETCTGKGSEGISTSQLRNIYGKIKTAKTAGELKMKRPVLAYLAARLQRNRSAQTMLAVLDDLMRQATDETLAGFKSFMEAVVAYHKYFDSLKQKNG